MQRLKAPDNFFKDTSFEYKGREIRALEVGIEHFSAYYRRDPDIERVISSGNRWKLVPGKFDIPALGSFADYAQVKNTVKVPEPIRIEIARYSQALVPILGDAMQRKVETDQLRGRLDKRKLPQMGRAIQANTYSARELRPYKRRDETPVHRPVIAIVGDINTLNCNDHDTYTYTNKLLTMVMAVHAATTATGCLSYAAVTQGDAGGFLRPPSVQAFMLVEPGKHRPAGDYLPLFVSSSMWMHFKVELKATHKAYAQVIAELNGSAGIAYDLLNYFGTSSGGYGVSWARQCLGADVVIGVGNFVDQKDADLLLQPRMTMDEAMDALKKSARTWHLRS